MLKIRTLRGRLLPLASVGCAVALSAGCMEYQLTRIDGYEGCPDAAREWDSGRTTSTSTSRERAPGGYALTGIRVFREPAANLDNFVSRLDVEYTRFTESSGVIRWTDDTVTETVYNGEYREGSGEWVRADEDHWITDVTVYVQNRDGYLKDVWVKSSRITSVRVTDTGTDGPAFGLSGRDYSLGCGDCDSVQLITGIEVQWDTRKGKVRRFEIECGSYSYDKVD